MRYLNMDCMSDIERMTLSEYFIRMKVAKLKRLDQEYFISLQAFKNQQIQATKNNKPLYKTFKDFFDIEKLEQDILGADKPKKDVKAEYLARLNAWKS